MMHYWNLLGDWNVIDSVRSVHSFFEGLAIALFALLVLFDILAHLYEDINRGRSKALERIGLCCFGLAILAEVATYKYSKRNDELSGAEIRDLSAVTHQARIDARGAAGSATDAKEVSAQAKERSLQAGTLAQSARRDADAVSKDLTSVKEQAGSLSAKLAEANRKADEELKARLKLEAQLINVEVCNAPRVLMSWSTGGKTSVDPLKPMAGAVVFIEFVADNEAQRAALNIAGVLSDAKWDVKSLTAVNGNGIKDGVDVQPYQGSHQHMELADWGNVQKADSIADAIVDFLHSYNWQAQRGWPVDSTGKMIRDDSILPPGSVRIRVGLYPAVMYVPPPGLAVLSDALAKFRGDAEKASQESKRRMQEQMRRMLDSLPPDQRKIAEDRAKQWDEDNKKLMSRYTNPCQSFLTPDLCAPAACGMTAEA